MKEAVDLWLDMEERRSAWCALLEASQDPEAAAIVLGLVSDLDNAIEQVRFDLVGENRLHRRG